MCPKVSIHTCGNYRLGGMFSSLKFDLYINLCGNGTFSGSGVYFSYLGVVIGIFRLSCLEVLPIVLSWVFGSFCDMSVVTLL